MERELCREVASSIATALLVFLASQSAAAAAPACRFEPLGVGVEYCAIKWIAQPEFGDGLLQVVRVDPTRAKLRAVSAGGMGANRTARQWAQQHGGKVVINAGMYEADFVRHTGYLRIGTALNNGRWVKSYQSVLLLGARRSELPAAQVLDRDSAAGQAFDYAQYHTVSQNLRLIKAPGHNVWRENNKRWSEAALAIDRQGRVLLLFSRSPLSMRQFNDKLLALPLGVVQAMHLEGGPEASLSIHTAALSLDLSGSYESGFNEADDNMRQWALPNVIIIE